MTQLMCRVVRRPIHDAHAAFTQTARDLKHPEATANLKCHVESKVYPSGACSGEKCP